MNDERLPWTSSARSAHFSLGVHGARKKFADGPGDLLAMGFEREVAGIEEAYFRSGNVALEGLGTGRQEEGIVLAPGRQERRLVLAEVGLKLRIHGDIALVVAEEI